jgi:hypothetical protein
VVLDHEGACSTRRPWMAKGIDWDKDTMIDMQALISRSIME